VNELKYLGKPAPDIAWDRGNFRCLKCCNASRNQIYTCDCRREHLEGAVKEAAELEETSEREWSFEIKKQFSEWSFLIGPNKPQGLPRGKFVAFLLRKTLEGGRA
jgi:hypothetical protein